VKHPHTACTQCTPRFHIKSPSPYLCQLHSGNISSIFSILLLSPGISHTPVEGKYPKDRVESDQLGEAVDTMNKFE
jgi:hypothetical protein